MTGAQDTIFALSSGSPPAAIAVIRISGPGADQALLQLTGTVPEPRRAATAIIRDPVSGDVLDNSLVLRFAAPRTATGEDIAELHLHGGRAVVAAVLQALSAIEGMRPAAPGEFTRRAFENGRLDLAEAEGLADLLEAETEAQRRSAAAIAGGALSRQVENWQSQLLGLAAGIEAALEFAEEDDVPARLSDKWDDGLQCLMADMQQWLQRPPAERLKEGVRVVIAGPPNTGKSSLFNVLAGRDAAITSPVPGTTRDVLEAPTAIAGTAFLLVDTAGLRESGDEIEAMGVNRARQSLDAADIVLWLGELEYRPERGRSVTVQSKIDIGPPRADVDARVSSKTGEGIGNLVAIIGERIKDLLPRQGEVAINRRHRSLLSKVFEQLRLAKNNDLLLKAEAIRLARTELDRITGHAGVDDMFDAIFTRFCIGK